MLTFPEVLTKSDVVVYADDADPNLFYLVPGRPRLRWESGRPVFNALFWTDAADGQTGSVAGLRGALLHFDMDLSIPQELRDSIKQELKASGYQQTRRDALVKLEKERLGLLNRSLKRLEDAEAEAKRDREGTPGSIPQKPSENVSPDIPPVGEIRFGSVRFLDGKVTLIEEASGGLVQWSSAGGPPSMMGDNNAAFALRLSPEGAAVWYRALEQDAAALSVRYELKFEARLPSLEIHIWAGAHEYRDIARTVGNSDSYDAAHCEYTDQVEGLTQALVQEGLIHIDIKKGTTQISDEHVSQLRSAALTMMTERVKQFLASNTLGLTPDERHKTDFRSIKDAFDAFAELRLTERDVITWGANPQATLTSFLGNLRPEERKGLITLVDMADPVVKTVEVQVCADAEWTADPPVSMLRVTVEYPGAADNKQQSLMLNKDRPSGIVRWRRAAHDKGEVKYKAEAYLRGAAMPIPLSHLWTPTDDATVPISVPALGRFLVRVRAAPEVFSGSSFTSMQVRYSYKNSDAPDHCEGTVVVLPGEKEGQPIAKTTYQMIDQPLRLEPFFYRKNQPEIPGAVVTVWMRAGQEELVTIAPPWKDSLSIGAVVQKDLGLKGVRVEVQHKEPESDDFSSEATIQLDAELDWSGQTTLVQLNKQNQSFRYRYTIDAAEQSATSPWIDAAGDQMLTLPVLAVKIHSEQLQLGTINAAAVLQLTYDDPSIPPQEFYLTAGSASPTWFVPRANPMLDSYSYTLTIIPLNPNKTETPMTPNSPGPPKTGKASGRHLILTP